MEENRNGAKAAIIVLGAAVVVLLLVVAFLLGRNAGNKKTPADPTAPPTEYYNVPTSPAVTDKSGADLTPASPTGEATLPAESVNAPRNLDISMTAGSLTFTTGAQFRVDYDDDVIRVKDSGGTLTIENEHSHPSASERRRMNVTVTVPETHAFDGVNMELGAGKLIVRSLKTDSLHLEFGAGSATFDDILVTGSAEIREGAGELNIKSGAIANLTLQCGAGATRLSATLTGSSRVDAAVGAVDLNFTGDPNAYTVAFQMGLGACYYNSEKIARSGEYGTGPNRVDVTGGFGVMRVNVG